MLRALTLALALLRGVSCGGPAMGWSSFNFFKLENVSEAIYRRAADELVALGLAAKGYVFVNTDDAIMLASRDANGDLQPDPAVWPSGLRATADYVHSRGLRFGIYTARAALTCGKRAGSCGHEAADAAFFARNLVDYVKDDACGPCGADSPLTSYGKMQRALWNTGRPFVLAVEGDPPLANLSRGGFGNSSRVGADIRPTFDSIVSLIDQGAGLWPWAGGTDADRPFYNDFDILEVGNGDFDPSLYPPDDAQGRGLTAARMHFAFWCALKSPLLLGNDLARADAATLAVVGNADALRVSQDPARAAVRRLRVAPPRDARLGATPWDAVAVVARCDAARPTQSWRWAGGAAPGGANATLTTTDAAGTTFCLAPAPSRENYVGSTNATLCATALWAVLPFNGSGGADFTIVQAPRGPPLYWYAAPLGSGPVAHSQYATGAGAPKPWAVADFDALVRGPGSALRAGDEARIPDNDLVGNVTLGGPFCLDIVPAGTLETWAGPLAGGGFAAILFNRSPSPDGITLSWDDLAALGGGARPGPLRVRDVWRERDAGVFDGAFTDDAVPAHGVTFLVLTPTLAARD